MHRVEIRSVSDGMSRPSLLCWRVLLRTLSMKPNGSHVLKVDFSMTPRCVVIS